MPKTEKIVKIAVQAHPGAKRNEVLRFDGGVWHIKVAAPPTEGKANKELIEFLSEILDVSKSHITIEKGTTRRRKMISIIGMTQEMADARLKEVNG